MIRGLGTQAGLGWTVLPVHMVNILLGSFLFFFLVSRLEVLEGVTYTALVDSPCGC